MPSGDLDKYRKCVGIMLINAAGEVFMGRRMDTPEHADAWQMPQGGIDEGEDVIAAALRELQEETGVRSVKVLGVSPEWVCYDVPAELAKRAWDGRYVGQCQKWVLMGFVGELAEVNINTAHPEFCEWRWEESDNAASLAVSFKRDIYSQIAAFFRPLIREYSLSCHTSGCGHIRRE